MRLTGLHHITMITGDAQRNVDFYADTLGLRFVKKTVNFDAPEAYHLYFGDESGTPGTILTWFEFPGAARGRAGIGQIHTLQLAVPTAAALDFWAARLGIERDGDRLRFEDPDGLQLELIVESLGNAPLAARHPEIPAEHAIVGLEGARAYSAFHAVEEGFLTRVLGFAYPAREGARAGEGARDGEYVLDGSERRFRWAYDPAPAYRGSQGAGSVHHIAWGTRDDEQLAWQERIHAAGGYVTDVKDRDYFKSIYFQEPRGVLFEIATLSPGFAIDEDPDHLGEELRLPKQHEHLRSQLERTLRPVINPRTRVTA
jgi:glyoxalase family protein